MAAHLSRPPTDPPVHELLALSERARLAFRFRGLDRKIEFGLPDLEGRTHIFKIHAKQLSEERNGTLKCESAGKNH